MAVRLECRSRYRHWIDGSGRYRRSLIHLGSIGGLRALGRWRTLWYIPGDISSTIAHQAHTRFLFAGRFSDSGRFLAPLPETPATARGLGRRFRRFLFRDTFHDTLFGQPVFIIPLRL